MNAPPERVLIAANPKSGAGPSAIKVAQLNQALQDRGFDCRIITSLEELKEQALRAHREHGLRAVVSAGGDGTADALANLLPAEVPLLVFPLGTENLLAKYLHLTDDVRDACDALTLNRQIQLDVGSAGGKLFLVMLSIGFDAEVVRHMTALRTGHISRWSYARPIMNSLRGYHFPQLQYEISEPQPFSGSAAWIFVFNVPRYAAALDFCPQADPRDGLLDVCTFAKSGVAWGMGYLSRLWLGRHQSMRGFAHARCSSLNVACGLDRRGREVADIPYQIDGDWGGILPLDIKVLPQRLTVIAAANNTGI